MVALAYKSLTWLVAAVYLFDGVVAGAAHNHGPAPADCGAVAGAHQEDHACEHTHSHSHEGGHHHQHSHSASDGWHDDSAPVVPHHHDDCAACRYSSLQAGALHITVPVEFKQSIATVDAKLLFFAAPQLSALHLARGPPAAA